jgi:hypothetical protein
MSNPLDTIRAAYEALRPDVLDDLRRASYDFMDTLRDALSADSDARYAQGIFGSDDSTAE